MKQSLTDLAVIDALWIGERKPDRVSSFIQLFQSKMSRTNINYSHNAFIFRYTGRLWEATTPGGVTDAEPTKALRGCLVRARKEIQLTVTNDFFQGWLQGERGKSYAHRQNLATLFPFLKPFYANGDTQRNCSEFLAAACQFSRYRIPRGNRDYLLPIDTARILQPVFFNYP